MSFTSTPPKKTKVFSTAKFSLALLLSLAAGAAHAHQVWVERDASGPARVQYGDVDGERPQGEALQKLLATTRVFAADPQKPFKTELKQGRLEAEVEGQGDVRMVNDGIWKPFKNKEGLMHAVIFNSRAGRAETAAVLDLEFVPVEANSSTIVLRFKGEPVAGKDVLIINPALWRRTFKTDEQGRITVPDVGKGRYFLLSKHEVEGEAEVGGQTVQSAAYVTSLTFIAD